jgi:hypothetical protein
MTTVATRRAAALATPGGAATQYEQTKRSKYQALADEVGAELVPLEPGENPPCLYGDASPGGALIVPSLIKLAA